MSGAFICFLSSLERKHRALYLIPILSTLIPFLSLMQLAKKKKKNSPWGSWLKNESLKSNLLICYSFKTAGQPLDISMPVLDPEKVLFLFLRSANLTGVRGRWPLKKILTENKSIRWLLNEPRLLIQLPLSNKKGKSVHSTPGQW